MTLNSTRCSGFLQILSLYMLILGRRTAAEEHFLCGSAVLAFCCMSFMLKDTFAVDKLLLKAMGSELELACFQQFTFLLFVATT